MADNNTIARPYAQAIFDLAQENNALDLWAGGLDIAKSILADGAVIEFLSKPELSNKQKLDFICDLFSAFEQHSSLFLGDDKSAINFLKLLIENDRVSILPDIAEHFKIDYENRIADETERLDNTANIKTLNKLGWSSKINLYKYIEENKHVQ